MVRVRKGWPGPFITAEWRNGAIPDWLWERDPGVLALDATGGVSMLDHPYPGITHAHPAYRAAEAAWLEASCAIAAEHLATRGGAVIDVQLDDEPSYPAWNRARAGSWSSRRPDAIGRSLPASLPRRPRCSRT